MNAISLARFLTHSSAKELAAALVEDLKLAILLNTESVCDFIAIISHGDNENLVRNWL